RDAIHPRRRSGCLFGPSSERGCRPGRWATSFSFGPCEPCAIAALCRQRSRLLRGSGDPTRFGDGRGPHPAPSPTGISRPQPGRGLPQRAICTLRAVSKRWRSPLCAAGFTIGATPARRDPNELALTLFPFPSLLNHSLSSPFSLANTF